MGYFFIFFKGNIGQENVFYDILEGKNVFLSYKNKKFKKSKKLNVILWLCQGIVISVCVPPIYKQRPKWTQL